MWVAQNAAHVLEPPFSTGIKAASAAIGSHQLLFSFTEFYRSSNVLMMILSVLTYVVIHAISENNLKWEKAYTTASISF